MIEALKPYAEYRASEVPWVGDIPRDWRVERTKRIFRKGKELNAKRKNTNVLSLTLRGVVNNDPDSPEGLVPKDYGTYQLFRGGDLVFKLIDLENLRTSRVGLVHEDGIMSSAYLRLIPRGDCNVRFFYFQYYDLYTRAVFNALGAGVRSTLGAEDLGEIRIVIPSPDEQAAIVRFLEHANRKIDGFIRAKRKLIGLLNEQKQAIIHRAVTRGLNPNIPLKSSGISWLGDIPAHWAVSSIKRLARAGAKTFTDGDWIELPFITDKGVRLIQTGNVGKGSYREKGFRYVSENTFLSFGCTEVEPGDVLICRLDGPVGRACLAPKLGMKMITSVDNTILKPRADVDPQFVVLIMTTTAWLSWIESMCRAGGGFRYRVSRSMLGALLVPMPPLAEQKEIVRQVVHQNAPLNESIGRTEREIALIQEYRTRLTADVVTGKLDVREAAASLPRQIETQEPEITDADKPDEEVEKAEDALG